MKRAILAILAAALLAACSTSTGGGSGGGGSGSTGNGDNGISKGLGSQDASADVSLGNCSTSFGTISCQVTITNHSSKTSDYYIEGEIDDSAGTNVGLANGFAQHVGAGQNARTTLDGVYTGKANGLTVKITQVQRTASS